MSGAASKGTVYLVGAGPGDTGLVTVRAAALIRDADVVVYDSLANPELLEWTRPDCERINAGKSPGRHCLPQGEIGALLVERARAGKSVVRLKGGDPFIFGRGGEELAVAEAAGIPCEIVPGVTAALASAACTGIPLTHRDDSSSITFLTGHEDPEKHQPQVDFRRFARTGGTLCIYMGIGQLERIVTELLEGGMDGTTPAAVVQWATLPRQRSLFSTLAELPAEVEATGLCAPAVVVIGPVVARPGHPGWFEKRPLFGRRIVVTRARKQAGQLTRLLEEQGADVLELPMIEVAPAADPATLTEALAGIAVYEWIIFTSVNGVEHFFEYFHRAYDDLRCLGPMRIAAVGNATAAAVRARRLTVDLTPSPANGDALADLLLAGESLDNVKMLVVTGNRNRDTLARRLEDEGRAIVDTLKVYRTDHTDLRDHPAAERFRREGADAVLFTSSSTLASFAANATALTLEPGARQPVFGSIGPLTTKTLEKYGLPLAFEAPEARLESFVGATLDHFRKLKLDG